MPSAHHTFPAPELPAGAVFERYRCECSCGWVAPSAHRNRVTAEIDGREHTRKAIAAEHAEEGQDR